MKWFIPVVLIAMVLLSACGAEKGIEVHNAWMRPAENGANGGVYFELNNHNSTPDELTGISTDVAVAAEIHESKMEGDVMKMEMLTSLPIEAFADMVFEPGGKHVMLVNLTRDLNLNDDFEIVLHFKNYEDITVHVLVKDSAPEENHDM